ncbi:MAG: 1-deoxy-D-xylulose-5-phosphate synthase [Abditibacteriota bacterium]|nr:1-deoxy-D-xylulose-5-phosphate synthase [Abditibacteriota bacterium]
MIKVNSPGDLKKLSPDEKKQYASELRETIIHTVSENGGHLASNLGVVELTIALHSVFDSPSDKIIWDVSHQAYAHKLICGRSDSFHTLRKPGGISGFTNTGESPHDLFTFGHAGASISAAMGLAKARDLSGGRERIVAVIGDGSIGSGLCFEALNNLAAARTDLIVVLNDNTMSISRNVGAFAKHLTKLRLKKKLARRYRDIRSMLAPLPGGSFLYKAIKGIINGFIRLFQSQQGVMFEELGISYLGPYDGHNIAELEDVLSAARRLSGGVLVHVITKKGMGYTHAEEHPDKFHGISPFEQNSGQVIAKPAGPSFTEIFSKKLVEMGERDPRITAITAGMADGTGVRAFASRFPERCYDVGISEGHAVTFAAGLAKGGRIPVAAVYSTFLQRAYDSIAHDICLQRLPVILAIDRAGLVGDDGPTHHGVFDIAYLRHLPNIEICAPRNGELLKALMDYAAAGSVATAVRYPRGAAPAPLAEEPVFTGDAQCLRKGSDALIAAAGPMVYTALEAAEMLLGEGIDLEVWDPVFVKPLSRALTARMAELGRPVFTLEDGAAAGGFGSAVGEMLTSAGCPGLHAMSFGIPDRFVEHGSVAYLREQLGLSAEAVAAEIKTRLASCRRDNG